MFQNYQFNKLCSQIKNTNYETIPIYLICFNNGFMVKNSVEILKNKFKNPIIILDNASDSIKTKKILQELKDQNVQVLHQSNNKGHFIIKEIESLHKDSYFIITDPDLELNYLPEDTIKILDKVGNGLRHGRHPSGPDAERLGRVLRGIASQLEA